MLSECFHTLNPLPSTLSKVGKEKPSRAKSKRVNCLAGSFALSSPFYDSPISPPAPPFTHILTSVLVGRILSERDISDDLVQGCKRTLLTNFDM